MGWFGDIQSWRLVRLLGSEMRKKFDDINLNQARGRGRVDQS